ncbi:MerR family transcriptional regulator [Stutzerimonas stutzeri]|uniref:MerR family transcriptional regulator n=1 Tax=Stutzerimonas stutzeri TaxID=316 RepID=A0A6I6LY80_STUST|nr:MerR family transcriptional regulator [Stutzerimonas stutzeri]QGZ31311.1 MerR family transcriptional regulator [Stutzerimonas stutzeri]
MTEPAHVPSQRAADSPSEALLPIREVSRLTGVNPVTLRAWERRYGLIQPIRTESGHRLYSKANVEAIRSILAWTERGVAVSKVGSILSRGVGPGAVAELAHSSAVDNRWGEWQAQVRRAVNGFDEDQLGHLYGDIFSACSPSVVFQQILLPLWQQMLVRQDAYGQTSEWLFLDHFLRARVLQRLQLARSHAQGHVLLAAVPGQCRELELLVAGLLLSSEAVAVNVLALGQPLDELPLVCAKVRPQALVIYTKVSPNTTLLRQLSKLSLSVECPLAMAGEGTIIAEENLRGSPIACLGDSGQLMQRRLLQLIDGHLDT